MPWFHIHEKYKQMWNMNASQKQPPVTLRGTMQVHARYSEVIVELYRMQTALHPLNVFNNMNQSQYVTGSVNRSVVYIQPFQISKFDKL